MATEKNVCEFSVALDNFQNLVKASTPKEALEKFCREMSLSLVSVEKLTKDELIYNTKAYNCRVVNRHKNTESFYSVAYNDNIRDIIGKIAPKDYKPISECTELSTIHARLPLSGYEYLKIIDKKRYAYILMLSLYGRYEIELQLYKYGKEKKSSNLVARQKIGHPVDDSVRTLRLKAAEYTEEFTNEFIKSVRRSKTTLKLYFDNDVKEYTLKPINCNDTDSIIRFLRDDCPDKIASFDMIGLYAEDREEYQSQYEGTMCELTFSNGIVKKYKIRVGTFKSLYKKKFVFTEKMCKQLRQLCSKKFNLDKLSKDYTDAVICTVLNSLCDANFKVHSPDYVINKEIKANITVNNIKWSCSTIRSWTNPLAAEEILKEVLYVMTGKKFNIHSLYGRDAKDEIVYSGLKLLK